MLTSKGVWLDSLMVIADIVAGNDLGILIFIIKNVASDRFENEQEILMKKAQFLETTFNYQERYYYFIDVTTPDDQYLECEKT